MGEKRNHKVWVLEGALWRQHVLFACGVSGSVLGEAPLFVLFNGHETLGSFWMELVTEPY